MNTPKLRAVKGHAIVKFVPYRREGTIQLVHRQVSVEAKIIDDATNLKLRRGTRVTVSRLAGEYFDHDGQRFCRVPENALILAL